MPLNGPRIAIVGVGGTPPVRRSDREELIAFCGERLARYERPRHVVFMHQDAFPRGENGKVLRQELERRLFGEAAGRDATWRS
jgi:acyl-CoA synthetase (AMP-forming)/AMP-acid ligase II